MWRRLAAAAVGSGGSWMRPRLPTAAAAAARLHAHIPHHQPRVAVAVGPSRLLQRASSSATTSSSTASAAAGAQQKAPAAAAASAPTPTPRATLHTRDNVLTIMHGRLLNQRGKDREAARMLRVVAGNSGLFSSRDFEVILGGFLGMPDDWKAGLHLLDIVEEAPQAELTPPMFEVVLLMAAMAERNAVVRTLWRRLHRLGLKPTESMYQCLIRSHTNAQLFPQALEAFRELAESDPDAVPQTNRVRTYRLVLHACARAGEWRIAMELLDHIEVDIVANENFGTDEQRLQLYNIAIDACVRAGRVEEAKSILPRIANARLHAQAVTMNTILKGCDPENAADTFAWLCGTGVEPNTRTFNMLIEKAGQAGNWQRALQWFVNIKTVGGLEPNTNSYAKLVYALGKGGQWRLALDTFQTMSETGFDPDVAVVVHVMQACQRAGQHALVLGIYDHMASRGQLEPQLRPMNVALHACCKVEALVAAARDGGGSGGGSGGAAQAMASAPPRQQAAAEGNGHDDGEAAAAAAAAEEEEGIWASDFQVDDPLAFGFRVLSDMQRMGLQPDAYTYATAMQLFGKYHTRARGAGLDMLQELMSRGVSLTPQAIQAALHFCGVVGAWEDGRNFQAFLYHAHGADWYTNNLRHTLGVLLLHALSRGSPEEALAQVAQLNELAPDVPVDDHLWHMMRTSANCNSREHPWPTIRAGLLPHDTSGAHMRLDAAGRPFLRTTSATAAPSRGRGRGRRGALAAAAAAAAATAAARDSNRQQATAGAPRDPRLVVPGVPPSMSNFALRQALAEQVGVEGILNVQNHNGVLVLHLESEPLRRRALQRIEWAASAARAGHAKYPSFLAKLQVGPVSRAGRRHVNNHSSSSSRSSSSRRQRQPRRPERVQAPPATSPAAAAASPRRQSKSRRRGGGGKAARPNFVVLTGAPPDMPAAQLRRELEHRLGVGGIATVESAGGVAVVHLDTPARRESARAKIRGAVHAARGGRPNAQPFLARVAVE